MPPEYFSAARSKELPRHVSFENGSFQWDDEKLCVSFTEAEKQDALFLVNVLTGKLITCRILPLLFDDASPRGYEFLRSVAANPKVLEKLSDSDTTLFNVGLRDWFYAASKSLLSEAEKELFRSVVELVEEPSPLLEAQGLAMSYYPTRTMKLVRFFEGEGDADQLLAEVAGTRMVFVDATELHYRTFENIVPLDKMFSAKPLSLELSKAKELKKKQVFLMTLGGPSAESLLEVDSLGLYVKPLNSSARGGSRFVFHSALLADALTKALRESPIPGVTNSASAFASVNSVFRMNRYEAGAKKFEEHMDAPYYDTQLRQCSRFTVIVYLTGGKGKDVLSFEGGTAIQEMEPMTVIVFDQSLQHAGNAFDSGDKLFLRSELIFNMTEREASQSDAGIGALFSRAVYLTKEAVVASSDVFASTLGRLEHDHYNAVSAAHWGKQGAKKAVKPVFFHKQFDGNHFLSNGYDYFFHGKSSNWDLERCAAIVLLDYFNAGCYGEPFASVCKSSITSDMAENTLESAFTFLDAQKYGTDEPTVFKRWTRQDRESLIPAVANVRDKIFDDEEEAKLTPEQRAVPVETCCCPFHCPVAGSEYFDEEEDGEAWDPLGNGDVTLLFNSCKRFVDAMLLDAAISIMGEEIRLSYENFVIRGNQIHILSSRQLAPVNFASCWNGIDPPHLIGASDKSLQALFPVVPPLLFSQQPNGLLHICLDFFRNNWMVVPSLQLHLPVPEFVVPEDVEEGEIEDTWFGHVGWKSDSDDWRNVRADGGYWRSDEVVFDDSLRRNAPYSRLEGSIREPSSPKAKSAKAKSAKGANCPKAQDDADGEFDKASLERVIAIMKRK